jgi:hypothetical protein
MPESDALEDQEFTELLEAVANRDVSAAQQERLAERLVADPDARAEFIKATAFEAMLAYEFPMADARVASSALDVPDSEPEARKRGARKTGLLSVVVVAVIVLVGWGAFQTHDGKPNNSADIVGHFADLSDSRWMDPATEVLSGDVIRTGQRIELSSGTAEVLFNTGAKLRIVGPTIFKPQTDNSVFLTLGEVHLVAETPESKGFTVVTPTSKFVDISTAFSARVSPDGLSRLNVSKGEVDVVLEGADRSPRLRAGETLYIEPGKRQVMTRIEEGDGTAAFRFSTIRPPSHEDLADLTLGRASVRVTRGQLNFKPGRGTSGSPAVLVDGTGQSNQDAPRESAFFQDHTSGSLLMDLGSVIAISRINSYSWHQHDTNESHRHRARQQFTLYGYLGDQLPDLTRPPRESGWTRIARVNTDRFFDVTAPLDRPAQQASSITAAQGEIGRFRYLLWEVNGNTFFGELDVFGSPHTIQETP